VEVVLGDAPAFAPLGETPEDGVVCPALGLVWLVLLGYGLCVGELL